MLPQIPCQLLACLVGPVELLLRAALVVLAVLRVAKHEAPPYYLVEPGEAGGPRVHRVGPLSCLGERGELDVAYRVEPVELPVEVAVGPVAVGPVAVGRVVVGLAVVGLEVVLAVVVLEVVLA